MKQTIVIQFRNLTILVVLVFLYGMMTSCGKNVQPVEDARFSGLFVRAITVDPFRFKLMIGDTVTTNTLQSPGNPVVVLSTHYEPKHRVRLYNFYGDELLLDTVIPFRGNPYYVTFYQDQPGGRLRWLGPPVNEALPAFGFTKLAIAYTATQLPASLKVVVEDGVDAAGNEFRAVDSFSLAKGAFSKYFTVQLLRYVKPRLKLYTTGSERKLIANVGPDQFSDLNIDYSTFLLDKATGSSLFTVTTTKIY